MFNLSKIRSNEAAFFAYKVWRIPYIIGAVIILANLLTLISSISFIYTTSFVSFARSFLDTIFGTAIWLVGWTMGSSLIFLLAFVGKKISRRFPFLILVLFPLPISLISLFIIYKIILITKEIFVFLGPISLYILLIPVGLVFIPLNLISWKSALSEYRRANLSQAG